MAERNDRREFLRRASLGLVAGSTGGAMADRLPPEAQYPPAGTAAANVAQVDVPRAGTPRDVGLRATARLDPLPMTHTGPGEIPRKPLGRTGVEVSAIGIGGATLGTADSYETAERIVHEAIDAGVNFFDNAWEYNGGKSEEWMGRALQGRRDRVFLMTKVCTHGRDATVAMRQLEESLRRLRTDHLDLWQIHEVVYFNDPEWHFRAGGVVEALTRAREQGKVRFVGFTGHKSPAIHLRMLQLADEHRFHFDTVQMPLNPCDGTYRSFEQLVLPEARRREMGVLGMKSLGGNGEMIQQGALTVEEALRYAMSLPAATTISGIEAVQVLHQNLAIARGFRPMTASEMQALRKRLAPLAADGHLELYKSSIRYDADEGRAQHGFPPQKEVPL